MKKIFKGVVVIALLYVSTIIGLYIFQEELIFLSEELPEAHQFEFNQPFEEITLTTSDGAKLHAIHFTVEDPVGIVLYFHGNAGTLEQWGTIASQFTTAKYDVLMMDYRGYGKSRGERTEDLLYQDANRFYEQAKIWFPEDEITVFGRSLGTTFATYVAAKNAPKALVLESPFYSLTSVVKTRYPMLPVNQLLRFEFNTAAYLEEVRCEVTIIHGTEDEVVPFEQGKRLVALLPQREVEFIEIKNGKHNNLNTYQEYTLAIKNLLTN
ncbi:MAG: alpha/beta fold hydrolase [Marinirhabdus sp.]|nr:alpha/beta fold hydrolase [Marinirhabdus sp.]